MISDNATAKQDMRNPSAMSIRRKTAVVSQNKPLYHFLKRLIDFLVALLGFVILAPLMLLIALAIKLNSKGPAVYKQERLGLDGKSFVMYKFRSMYLDAESEGPQWAEKNDDRTTSLGGFLRLCRLDELPQLINILKGDMSIVGPRPERSIFYDEFEKTVPDFRDRLAVIPGLTGWAQINGGYEIGPAEKLQYDKEYIRNRSLWLDFKIILRTSITILTRDGAR